MSQRICRLEDIPEEGAIGLDVDGNALVAVRRDGEVHIYLNWCPHLGIELNFMPDEFLDSERQFIICANHGALFEIDSGDCISGPCAGDALVKVPHEMRGDEVWVGEVPQPA